MQVMPQGWQWASRIGSVGEPEVLALESRLVAGSLGRAFETELGRVLSSIVLGKIRV